MLNISSLSKCYGRNTVLDEVDFSLKGGSLNVLTGSNGTGKSTLLRLIAQIERPTGGNIELFGRVPVPLQIGYLPQNLHFNSLLTVVNIIQFYASVWGLPKTVAQAALVRWGLETHQGKRTGELSGGLRQRLGLAVLYLRPAALILLDEPGLSLDPYWRNQLGEWLMRLAQEGVIVLATTHIGQEWADKADRMLCCEEGKVRDALVGKDAVSSSALSYRGESALCARNHSSEAMSLFAEPDRVAGGKR